LHYEPLGPLNDRSLAGTTGADKHTFIEKPLATSSEIAGDLIELATERDLVLMCGHSCLYSPPARGVRRPIEPASWAILLCLRIICL
jgi:hypothetical protein